MSKKTRDLAEFFTNCAETKSLALSLSSQCAPGNQIRDVYADNLAMLAVYVHRLHETVLPLED